MRLSKSWMASLLVLKALFVESKDNPRIGIVVNGVGTIFMAYIPKGMLKKV